MNVYYKSDTGKVRNENEDAIYVNCINNIYLFILADGMGGYSGGKIAANSTVEITKNAIEKEILKIQEDEFKDNKILKLIDKAIKKANKNILKMAFKDENLKHMGTTLEIALLVGNKMYYGHVGDSRIYILKDGNLEQLTSDDSYVQELIKNGKITKSESKTHPDKNMLTKAIGGSEDIIPIVKIEDLKGVSCILICSDGLTNMLSDEEILDVLSKKDEKDRAEELINFANLKGGYDNISAIVIYE